MNQCQMMGRKLLAAEEDGRYIKVGWVQPINTSVPSSAYKMYDFDLNTETLSVDAMPQSQGWKVAWCLENDKPWDGQQNLAVHFNCTYSSTFISNIMYLSFGSMWGRKEISMDQDRKLVTVTKDAVLINGVSSITRGGDTILSETYDITIGRSYIRHYGITRTTNGVITDKRVPAVDTITGNCGFLDEVSGTFYPFDSGSTYGN